MIAWFWPEFRLRWRQRPKFSLVKRRALAFFQSPMHRRFYGGWKPSSKLERGVVCWDTMPPANVPQVMHYLSFQEAIEMASGFLETDYTKERETIVVGRFGRQVVEMLPTIVRQDCDGLLPREGTRAVIGRLNRRKVLYDSLVADKNLLFNETTKRFVLIHILHWYSSI